MNVSELLHLTHWVTREIVDQDIAGKYQALQQILHENAQQGQPNRPFESQRTTLLEALRAVRTDILTKDQLEFLNRLGIGAAIGEPGAEAVESILYRNVIDIASSARTLAEIHATLTNGISKSQQLAVGLTGSVSEQSDELEEDVLMRITFTSGAAMKNVADFKRWGSTWYDIGRGISMAHGAAPEEIRVVGATRGSIIIELGVAYVIAKTTSHIILEALKVVEKVLELRKTVEQIKAMQLQNKKVAHELEKEIETEKTAGVERITTQVQKKLKLKADEGDKLAALQKAVKSLVNFVERGGEVDFVVPEIEEDEEEGEETTDANASIDYKPLKEQAAEIRQIEAKLKLLGYSPDGDTQDHADD